MATRYWVGGTGNWSDTARWSTTSGGASGASVPVAADVVYFDDNSDVGAANFTATVDIAITIGTLFCTFNVASTVTFATAGNLTVTANTSLDVAAADVLLINGNASLGVFTLTQGTLSINGGTITMTRFVSISSNTRTLAFGTNGTINITGSGATVWSIDTSGVSTISGTGTVNLTYSGGTGTRTIRHAPDTGTANASFKVSAGTDTVVFTASNSIGALDFTGFSGTWTNVALTMSGSLTVSTGMTVGAGANTVTMSSTGSRNITSNGRTIDFPLTIDGVGGTVTLQDALTIGSTTTLTLTNGTLSLGTNNVSTGIFSSSNSNTRGLNFGTGKLTLTGNNATIFDVTTATGFTTSGTVYIESTYTGGTGTRTFSTGFSTAQSAGYDVKTSGSSGIVIGTTATDIVALTGSYGSIDLTGFTNTLANTVRTTYGSLTLPASGGTFTAGANATTFGSTSSQTLTSNGRTIDFPLTVNGVGGTVTLQDALTIGSTTTLTLTNGTLSLGTNTLSTGIFVSSNSNTRVLNFGTGKLELTGNNATIFNLATATGFTTSGTVYIESTYTGGTGTRTFSTGFNQTQSAGYDVKTSGSSGIVIGTTATDIVALTGSYGNIDFTGFTNTLAITARTIYGNLTFPASGGTFAAGSLVTTFSGSTSKTLTSNGRTIDFPLTVNGVGGTVTLQDALTLGSIRTLTLTAGTFNANNYNVTTGLVSSSGTSNRTLTMGSGLWTLSGVGTVWDLATTTNLTFNKDTANILLSNNTTTARTFSGGSLTYNKLTIGGSTSTSSTTLSGNNTTFNEIDTTKTVAHTVAFPSSTNINVNTWSINGSAGNVVTLSGNATFTGSLTKLGGGYLSGYDYFIIDSVSALPTNTWYIGTNSTYNTTTNTGYGFFTTQRATRAIIVLTSTTSTTWTVPADWNNANNDIVLIGGGGGGGGSKNSGANSVGGGGGGGGGCTQISNQSFSVNSNITYQAGAAGSAGAAGGNGGAGGTTSWNSGASTAGGGGGGSSNAATPSSTGGTAGTGTKFNGGVGGAGSTTTTSTFTGGGGGGGAAGVDGAGQNGGIGFTGSGATQNAGGGGGGSNGGTAGGNASSSTGGTGGNNFSGVGGGASNTSGAVGGGGGGSTSADCRGGAGVNQFGVGSGGGAGGGADGPNTDAPGGTYGGGGGGGGTAITTTYPGSAGFQGAIIISYQPSLVTSGNFFQIF